MTYRKMALSTGVSPPHKSLRVLCAEDDPNVALILKYALETAGHQVECFNDGETAFARVISDMRSFDLVITDHQMPSLSGLRLVEKLREAKYPGRIIVHSSNLRETAASAYRALGVDHILRKPAQLTELMDAVHGIDQATP